ncbi:MAG: TIGR04255 family protein [Deltaproteobacteria bacterium]|jgi:uncharacterized protein (TIGR04255 family)|nr:TIGR04255 family protein [Deltaproteobacteria bacterium]
MNIDYIVIESIFELRFQPNKLSVSEILPGMIYSHLSDDFPTVQKLPLANFPTILVNNDPNLLYLPTVILQGTNCSLQIGNRVVSLSYLTPFAEWDFFSNKISKITKTIENTKQIEQLESFSIKYIYLSETKSRLSNFNVFIVVDGYNIANENISLQYQIKKDNIITHVKIISPAEIKLFQSGTKKNGVVVTIDCINEILNDKTNPWEYIYININDVYESINLLSKKIFKYKNNN